MKGSHRESFALIAKDGLVHRYSGESATFDQLEQAQAEPDEMILAIPFRQAIFGNRPLSEAERSARHRVSAIRIRGVQKSPVSDFLQETSSGPTRLVGGHFDIDDTDFAERVGCVVENEIRAGHGSNFVLHRTYRGRIAARTHDTELALFRSLLRGEAGSYWTFLVHFPDHTLVGASPEMHLRRNSDGLTTMNPISGTYRYPNGRPDERTLREFLQNPKERNELYMVVDEELKIMSDLCDERPWISQPSLRFMSNLAHTEYLIHGYSSLPWTAAVRRSLIAPTVIGSPLESAFRMAFRNDASPRNYLGGVLAHVASGNGQSLDSTILIRTACIESTGEVSIPVGSTIVRDSNPVHEAAETAAKASGILAAFTGPDQEALTSIANTLLEQRADDVAEFWARPAPRNLDSAVASTLNAIVVDHEDRFTGMLAAHLRHLGLNVTLTTTAPRRDQLADADLLVLGPGPGDPNDEHDPRIVSARELARWVVDSRMIPTLAVCLSHQLIARELGLDVRRLPRPNQGSQRQITLFGEQVRVGFYNSFSAFSTNSSLPDLDISADATTGEIFALRTDGIIGLQFHPESVLSIDGARVLSESILALLRKETVAARNPTDIATPHAGADDARDRIPA